ncbi:hypothetical protein [Sphingobium yanoikuyae]|uniref:hypothetical protein n=1 Tax=Sphingobium yanoikuyae TaxID=13690 RepID=UPI0011131246|nr:hypothetical protein [Sphingobium yanoikuyae]
MSGSTVFDAHCLALGKLSVTWAFIDRQLNDLLRAMLGCSEGAAASIATSADSIAARIKIVRLLNGENPISSAWTLAFERLLQTLEQTARTRNRYIHDRWELTQEGLVRIDRRAATRKPQSRHPIVLEFDTEHVTDPADVEALTSTVGKLVLVLHCAIRDQEDWREKGRTFNETTLLLQAEDYEALPDAIEMLGFVS